ncbi:LuxR C-terminal-related transcriptional regulator [Streptomyces smyrnaeus]|uniref:helix-turn-helix transcriptional regulator n=1 Tax=Streptomyces smyrnaeus TaxID=1387713 RepID=UPI0033BE317D
MFAPERGLGDTVPDTPEGSGTPYDQEPAAGFLAGPGFGTLHGRREELDLLAGLLTDERERLITLTGPAGVGKSHLAHSAVAARLWRGAVPVLWTDLAEAAGAASLWSAVGAATAERAEERIGTAELLVVLNNCDPVATDVALHLASLLRACPRLKVLVTSRVPLNIRAERLFLVAPLPTGEGSPAERLFTAGVGPYYRAGLAEGDGPSVVAQICRELDGIPLAIELAAEAVGSEGPHAVLKRLRDGVPAGGRRLRDAPARHGSVASALRWGARPLSTAERALLDGLAVFEAPVGLSEAGRTAGLEREELVAGIESLVRRSLLLSRTGPRGPEFRLPQPVRVHYRTQLADRPAALADARDGHADCCAHFAAGIAEGLRRGQDVAQLLSLVETRLPDLRTATRHLRVRGDHAAALRLLTALEIPLLGHGLAPDAVEELAESAAAHRAEAGGPLTAQALLAVARWTLEHGAQRRAEEALDAADAAAAGHPGTRARVAALSGELLRRRGDPVAADLLLGSALEGLCAAGDTLGAAMARRSQSLLRAALGDPDAEQPVLTALAEQPAVPGPSGAPEVMSGAPGGAGEAWTDPVSPVAVRATLLAALARVRGTLGRTDEAYEDVRESMRLLLCTGGPAEVAEVLETLALVTAHPGDEAQPEALARVLACAENIRRRHGLAAAEHPELSAVPERLRKGLDAGVLRRLRRGAQGVSLHDALIAGLFAPGPRRKPAARTTKPAAPHGLTPRQHEIALLVTEGMTNRQIGTELGISEWTVTNHLRAVMQKLECGSRVQVVRALQRARP